MPQLTRSAVRWIGYTSSAAGIDWQVCCACSPTRVDGLPPVLAAALKTQLCHNRYGYVTHDGFSGRHADKPRLMFNCAQAH
jgi:hypothetical protein